MSKSKLIELAGFAPDRAEDGPGNMVLAHQWVPTNRGLKTFPKWTNFGWQPGGNLGITLAFPSMIRVDAERKVYDDAGLTDNEYILFGENANAAYYHYGVHIGVTATTSAPQFTQIYTHNFGVNVPRVRRAARFGDYVLALPRNVVGSSSPALLAYNPDVGGTATAYASNVVPPASSMVVASRFVMMLGGSGQTTALSFSSDAWWCSARDNHASWTLSAATLCTRGRLVDTSGPIIDAVEFNGDVIVLKSNALYRGRYVPDTTEVWHWEKLPFKIDIPGIQGLRRMAVTEFGIFFVGASRLYLYDGAQVTEMPAPWQDAITLVDPEEQVDDLSLYGIFDRGEILYDPGTKRLYLFQDNTPYPTSLSSGGIDTLLLIYHIPTQRWTTARQEIVGLCVGVVASATVMMGFARSSSTDAENTRLLALNEPAAQFMGVGSGGFFFAGSGDDARPTFVTGDFGDDFADSELTEARLRFKVAPSASTCVPMHRESLDDALTTATTVAAAAGKYDLRQLDRWHRLKFTLPVSSAQTYPTEVIGLRLVMETAGETGED